MAMCIVQDRWHSFIPSAPNLVFQIPAYSFEGQRTLTYEYKYEGPEKVLDRKLMAFSKFLVQINGLPWYNFSVFRSNSLIKFESRLIGGSEWSKLPVAGDRVTVRGYEVLDSSSDRYYHLDLGQVLIQGAVPYEQTVLNEHERFQGGSRLKHVALSLPKFGSARYCGSKQGFDYQPPLGFDGIDSFAYYLETQYGQRSDAACITVEVGNVSIGE